MKIPSSDIEQEKNLVRAHRESLAEREKHLQRVNEQLKGEERLLRDQSDLRLQEIKESNNQRLIEEQLAKEKKLLDLEKDFQNTNDSLSQRLDQIKNRNSSIEQDLSFKHQQNIQKIHQENNQIIDEQNLNANEQSSQLDSKLKLDLEKQRIRGFEQLSALSSEHEKRTQNTNLTNRIEIDTLNRQHAQEVYQKQSEFLKEKEFQDKMQARQLEKMQNEFNEKMKLEVGTQNNVIRTTLSDFEKRYGELLEFQRTRMEEMQNRYDQEIKEIQSNFNAQKNFITERSQDPFYQTLVLRSKVIDMEKGYLVTVPLPEHEADNVQVGGDKRDITLTFNRRFEGELDIPDENESYKSKNYQTIVKTFHVPEIIDQKSVTRKYEDGLVKFMIKKA